VSLVNLQTAAVQQSYKVLTDVANILLAGNGYAYLFPARIWSDIYSLHIDSGSVTATSAIYKGRIPRLYADGNYMYLGGNDFSKWSIGQGVASPVNTAYLYNVNNLWLSEDGMRMITSAGKIYRTSNNPAEDLQANGSLSHAVHSVVWADEAITPGLTAVLAKSDSLLQGADELQIYADATLRLARVMPMNPFFTGDNFYQGYGQFAFWDAAETNLIVVEKVDASAGFLSGYGIAVLAPLNAKSDFDGDGSSDLLWRNSSTGEAILWYMNGASTKDKVSVGMVSDQNWRISGIADFDNDGGTDILWRNNSSGENYIEFKMQKCKRAVPGSGPFLRLLMHG
jgi:hypothetical protein